jgi:hypothetical protein
MKLQRVDRLKEPPIVGQHYLVPLVPGEWNHMIRDWPVIGLKHDDKEFLDFQWKHYHLDYRFVRLRRTFLRDVHSTPLHGAETVNRHVDWQPLGKLFYGRRKCLREQHVFIGPDGDKMKKLNDGFKGRICPKGKRGFVCPHQQFPLGSTPAINGVITCPLHGLQINADTGMILGASMIPREEYYAKRYR